MLATFSLEYLFALWALIYHRHTRFGQVAIMVLLCLGTFQLAEYNICTADGGRLWAEIGMVAITLLPPLGLYLIGIISGRLTSARISLALSLAFIASFFIIPNAIGFPICGGNYIILKTQTGLAFAYGWYYIGYLLWALWEGYKTLQTQQLVKPLRSGLVWLLGGYLAFMLPTGAVYLLSEKAREAIPSIMCGFALALAVIIMTNVLPRYHEVFPAKS